MTIRRKGREWFPLAVGARTYTVRLDYGCPGQWTAVAVAPAATGRARVAAVSAGPFRAPVLRLLEARLGGRPGGDPDGVQDGEHRSAGRVRASRAVR